MVDSYLLRLSSNIQHESKKLHKVTLGVISHGTKNKSGNGDVVFRREN